MQVIIQMSQVQSVLSNCIGKKKKMEQNFSLIV